MPPRVNHIASNIPEGIKDAVHRSAEKKGHAAAMIINLEASNSPHLEAWKDEFEVWDERNRSAIESAPLNKGALATYAAGIAGQSFEGTVVLSFAEVRAA